MAGTCQEYSFSFLPVVSRKAYFIFFFFFLEILTLLYIFPHNSQLILPQRASLAGVGSHIFIKSRPMIIYMLKLRYILPFSHCAPMYGISILAMQKDPQLLFCNFL